MIMSRCNKCGTMIKYRESYCDKCKIDKKKEDNYKRSMFDKSDDIRKARNTRRWRKVREQVIDSQYGLCVACYVQGRVTPIEHVHHIVSAKDSLDMFYDIDNLVGLCSDCHIIIHQNKIKNKKEFENYLENIIKR